MTPKAPDQPGGPNSAVQPDVDALLEERAARPGPFQGGGRKRQWDKRKLMIGFIVILGLALVALLIIYFNLNRSGERPTKVDGMTHLLSVYGFQKYRFSRPSGVAYYDGLIYMTDTGNDAIFVLKDRGRTLTRRIDLKKELLAAAASRVRDKSTQHTSRMTIRPIGIAVSQDRIFAASKLNNVVYSMDKTGKLKGLYRLRWPISLAFRNDRLYVTTGEGVTILDATGTRLLGRFGRRGRQDGRFDFPNGIWVNDEGKMFISDTNNARVVSYGRDEKQIWTLGTPPTSLKDKTKLFGIPTGIDEGSDGNLYVMDAFRGTFHIISPAGRHIDEIGDWGTEDGQFYYPAGIAGMGGGLFAVADKMNDRLQVVRIRSDKTGSGDRFGCSP